MKELINIHNAFGDINFDPDQHKYTSKKTKQRLTSVTTKITKFQQKFDTKYWTHYKALEACGVKVHKGLTTEDMVKMFKKLKTPIMTPAILAKKWKKEAMNGKSVGTYVHARTEAFFLNKEDIEFTTLDEVLKNKALPIVEQAKQYIIDHPYYLAVKTELIVADIKSNIAGQCDALLFDTRTEEFIVFDLKTDKDLKLTNPYQNMLPPLNHLEDSTINKYALQLSIYRYCLEENAGIKINKCIVVNVNLTNPTYVEYELPYLKKEVILMLNTSNKKKNENTSTDNIYRPNFN